jgi:hypothetical protein
MLKPTLTVAARADAVHGRVSGDNLAAKMQDD